MLSYLLTEVKLHARVNDLNDDGEHLLHIAAGNGNERMIFELAGDEPGYGANVNATNKQGDTPLHIAVRSKMASAVRFLMSLGSTISAQNARRESPLHLSVKSENLRSCKDLLLKGAERSVLDSDGHKSIDYVD